MVAKAVVLPLQVTVPLRVVRVAMVAMAVMLVPLDSLRSMAQ